MRAGTAILLLVALAGGLTACRGAKPSAGAYTARLAAAFDAEEGGDLGDTEAACASRSFVDLVGIGRLRAAAPEPALLAVAHLKDLGIDLADRVATTRVAGLLGACGVDAGSVDVRRLQGLPGEIVRVALSAPYADAIAGFATFDGSTTDLTREEAGCVGRATVDVVGLDTLIRLGPPAKLASAANLAAAGLTVTEADADAFGPAVAACGVQLRRILGAAFARVTDQRVAACMLGTLKDIEVGRFAYVTLVGQLSTGPSSTPAVALPFEACGFFGTADQRAYVDALVATLKVDPRFRADGERATCVATAFISTVTPKALDRAGITASRVRVGDLVFLGLGESAAAAFVQAYGGCGTPPVALLIEVLSRRTLVTPERSACITTAVDAVAARDLLVGLLTSPDGPRLTDGRLQSVASALADCGVLADAVR